MPGAIRSAGWGERSAKPINQSELIDIAEFVIGRAVGRTRSTHPAS